MPAYTGCCLVGSRGGKGIVENTLTVYNIFNIKKVIYKICKSFFFN